MNLEWPLSINSIHDLTPNEMVFSLFLEVAGKCLTLNLASDLTTLRRKIRYGNFWGKRSSTSLDSLKLVR